MKDKIVAVLYCVSCVFTPQLVVQRAELTDNIISLHLEESVAKFLSKSQIRAADQHSGSTELQQYNTGRLKMQPLF